MWMQLNSDFPFCLQGSDNISLKSSSDIIDFICFQKVSKKPEQINITEYTSPLPATPDWIWDSAGHHRQNSNIMDEIWNNLSWHCAYYDFKHALIGFCVWGTSEVINYHCLSALVKATAAFHRGLAGSFVYKERDRNRPSEGCVSYKLPSESECEWEKSENQFRLSTLLIETFTCIYSFFSISMCINITQHPKNLYYYWMYGYFYWSCFSTTEQVQGNQTLLLNKL